RRHLILESVELGIVEDLPPPAARRGIARLGGFPPVHFLVGGRHRHRRTLVVRPDHASRAQAQGENRQPGTTHHLSPGLRFGSANRTGVPDTSESGGSTITASAGSRPDTISTALP